MHSLLRWLGESVSTSGLNMCSEDTSRRADDLLCRLRDRTRCGAGAGERRAERLFVAQPSPVAAAKALKNPAELDGMREAHLRDSVALAETLLWLEQEVWPA